MSDDIQTTDYIKPDKQDSAVDIFLGKDSTLEDLRQAYESARLEMLNRSVQHIGSGESAEIESPINAVCFDEDVYALVGFDFGARTPEAAEKMFRMQRNPLPNMVQSGTYLPLIFQTGPRGKVANGITMEVLLNVCLHRLRSLNQPPFDCEENYKAANHIEEALMDLAARSERRLEEGRHNTNDPDTSATLEA